MPKTPRRAGPTKLRQEAGRFIAAHRVVAGLSQLQLAQILGHDYYTFISQIETGRRRVPTHEIERWAKALGVQDLQTFARRLISYYEPAMFRLLFGTQEGSGRPEAAPESIQKGPAREVMAQDNGPAPAQ